MQRFGFVSAGLTAAVVLSGCQQKPVEAKAESAPAAPVAALAAVAETPEPAQATIPEGCRIMNAFGWKASVNAQPPERPRLGVSGSVVVNTTGYQLALVRNAIDINPRIVTIDLVVTPPAPGTMTGQVITTQQVSGRAPNLSSAELDKVIVRCGSGTLAEITDVPTHH